MPLQQTQHRTQLSPSTKLVISLVKTYKRKGKNARQSVRGGKDGGSVRKQQCEHQCQRKKGEEVLQQIFPCSPGKRPHWSRHLHCRLWRTPCQSRQIFPCRKLQHVESPQVGATPHEGSMPEQGRSVRRKREAERNCYGLTATLCSPPLALGAEPFF